MRNILFFIGLTLLLAGCATNELEQQKKSRLQELKKDWELVKAQSVFSLSEYQHLEGNYNEAYQLIRLAEQFDHESIYLKEKIFDYLFPRARHDSLAARQFIDLGEQWYEDGIYNSNILHQLAQVCLWNNELQKADKYFQQSLTEDAPKKYYLSYYLFREEYFPPADTLYLHQVTSGEWQNEDEGVIYQVADIHKSLGYIKKARDLLYKAYQHWHNLQALVNLVALNQNLEDIQSSKELLAERYSKFNDLPDNLITYLIGVYYESGDYEKVLAMENESRLSGNELILKMMFLSALNLHDYEAIYRIGDLLWAAGYITEDFYPSFYGSFWQLELQTGNWEAALENFSKIGDTIDKLGLVYEALLKFEDPELLGSFLEYYYKTTLRKNEALFLLMIYNLETDNQNRAPELLSLIDKTIFEDNRLLAALAAAYNPPEGTENLNLNYLKKEFADQQLFLGILYYHLKMIPQAELALRQAKADDSLNEQGVLLLATILLDKQDNDEVMKILSWGKQQFPAAVDILNFYGYQIAVLQKTELYKEAENALLKALEMQPDNAMYWDSLAWLYYRMQKYDKALAAMDSTGNVIFRHSEIAFHMAAILYEKKDYEAASKYLVTAMELAGSDKIKAELELLKNKLTEKQEE